MPTSTEEVISTSSDDEEIYTIESSETIVSDERSDAGNIVTTEIVTTDRTITEVLELDIEPFATVEPEKSIESSTETKEPVVAMSTDKSERNQLCFELTVDKTKHKFSLGDAIAGQHTDRSEIFKGRDS